MQDDAADLRAMHDALTDALEAKLANDGAWRAFKIANKAVIAGLEKTITELRSKPTNSHGLTDRETNTGRAKAACETIMREAHNQPIPVSELYRKLAFSGIRLGGKIPLKQLSAILCNDPIFASTQDGWCLATEEQRDEKAKALVEPWQKLRRSSGLTYAELAIQAITQAGTPLTTFEIVEFVAQHRPQLQRDSRKAKAAIASALSVDDRMENRHVDGIGRAWCIVDRSTSDKPAMNGHNLHHEQSEVSN